MTTRQFAHLGPLFEADRRRAGLQVALESFLGRARTMLSIAPQKPGPGQMSEGVRRLVEMVAEAHGVPVRQVTGKDRRAEVVAARHEAWFRLAACGYSQPVTAKMFRCRPSTLVPALRGFRERFPEKAAEIERAARAPLHAVPAAEERRAA